MQSQVEELSPILVEVSVEIPWEKVSEELDKAYKSLQKKAKVRGFRPGKVPRKVVQNLFGKSVAGEVTQNLVREGIGAAVEEHEIQLVAVPHVDEPTLQDGAPLKFAAKIEVRPKIASVELSGLEVERVLEPVAADAVDRELSQMREQNADLVSPEPARGAKEGDQLTISLQATLEGERRPEMDVEETKVELGAGRMLPDLEAGLHGMTVDEEKTVEVTFPDDYGREDLQGKHASFQVVLKQMQEKVLPELDDEFAKDLEFESLSALRQNIAERLQEQAEKRADALLNEAVVEKLIDLNPLEVPPSMVQQQQRAMLQELFQFQQMFGQGIDFGEEMMKDLGGRAERKVRGGLLLGEIARTEKLEVSDDEVEQELKATAERSGKHIAKVRAEHQGQQRERLEARLLENKLLEYLRSRATIREVTAPEAAAEGDGDEAKADK